MSDVFAPPSLEQMRERLDRARSCHRGQVPECRAILLDLRSDIDTALADGSADPAVTAALEDTESERHLRLDRLWAALTAGRLIVPVAAHALPGRGAAGRADDSGRAGAPESGTRAEDPARDAAALAVDLPDGRTALPVFTSAAAMTAWLESKGSGRGAVTYRLRDWLFSRQRYWGEPFPIVWDEDGRVHALPESALPVELPEVTDYSPRTYDPDDASSNPEPPLGGARDWVEVTLDLGDGPRRYRRETNTMPNWAGSCWYELRYIDPGDDDAMVDPVNEAYWMGPRPQAGNASGGTDLYVGGVEHAVLHLLYSRFWHKILFDLGVVSSSEPYHRLFNQGYIQAWAYKDSRGQYVPADEVERGPDGDDGEPTFTWRGEPVRREYGKMGKSLKNIVTPDDMYSAYGADTFRVYEMSMGPLDQDRPWETRAVAGAQRFLQRLWRNVVDEATGEVIVSDEPADEATRRLVARTIVGVRGDYEGMRLNTAIAKLIVLNNHLTGLKRVPREAIEALTLMTAPVAPHIAEEIWMRLGHGQSLAHKAFPVVADASLLEAETVTCVVQVKGKVRDRLQVAPDVSEADLEQMALAAPGVVRALGGRGVRRVIVKAPRLVSIVPE